MKKSLMIIVLAALQYGCANQPATPDDGSLLIGFTEIASEITVGYQKVEPGDARDEPITFGYAE
jgi:hypothetical protein